MVGTMWQIGLLTVKARTHKIGAAISGPRIHGKVFSGSDLFDVRAPYILSADDLGDFLELCGKPSMLEADDFLGACYRKAMTPKKLWTLLFSPRIAGKNFYGQEDFSDSEHFLNWPLNWLNVILSRLQPLDRYKDPLCDRECDWEAPISP